MLIDARYQRHQGSLHAADCEQILNAAADPLTHPDVLGIYAILEDPRRPGIPQYREHTPGILYAVIANPSTRLETLERLEGFLDQAPQAETLRDTLRSQLELRMPEAKDRQAYWFRKIFRKVQNVGR